MEILEQEYVMVAIGALLLLWLIWIPRIMSPLLIKRYDRFPPWLKAFVALALPTLEHFLLNAWDKAYTKYIVPTVKETPTQIDDKLFDDINEIVQKALQSYQIVSEDGHGYTNEREGVSHVGSVTHIGGAPHVGLE